MILWILLVLILFCTCQSARLIAAVDDRFIEEIPEIFARSSVNEISLALGSSVKNQDWEMARLLTVLMDSDLKISVLIGSLDMLNMRAFEYLLSNGNFESMPALSIALERFLKLQIGINRVDCIPRLMCRDLKMDVTTAISLAALLGHLHIVEYIVHGSDRTVDEIRWGVNFAVDKAVGNLPMMRYLIEDCRCSVEELGAGINWAFRRASMVGDYLTMKYLLAVRGDWRLMWRGWRAAITGAVENDNMPMVQYLIGVTNGQAVDIEWIEGLVKTAAVSGSEAVVECLLSSNLNLDAMGGLWIALTHGRRGVAVLFARKVMQKGQFNVRTVDVLVSRMMQQSNVIGLVALFESFSENDPWVLGKLREMVQMDFYDFVQLIPWRRFQNGHLVAEAMAKNIIKDARFTPLISNCGFADWKGLLPILMAVAECSGDEMLCYLVVQLSVLC